MSEDVEKKLAELQRQLDELKAKLPAEKPEFVPRAPMPKIDWTAGMKMDASATKAMADVVPDVKDQKPMSAEEVQSMWARSKMHSPGGFGPSDWRRVKREAAQERKEEETSKFEKWRRETGWSNKPGG
jgi:hypothetical protein